LLQFGRKSVSRSGSIGSRLILVVLLQPSSEAIARNGAEVGKSPERMYIPCRVTWPVDLHADAVSVPENFQVPSIRSCDCWELWRAVRGLRLYRIGKERERNRVWNHKSQCVL